MLRMHICRTGMAHRVLSLFVLSLVALAICISGASAGEPRNTQNPPQNLRVSKVESGYTLAADGLDSFHTTPNEIANARIISVPDSRAQLVLWQEKLADGRIADFYAISPDGRRVARAQQTSYDLLLRYGPFDPRASMSSQQTREGSGALNLRAPLRSEEAKETHIVQFVTQPLGEFREQIRALGGRIYKYLPNHAYLVQMDAKTRGAVEALPFVRWVGEYQAAYKLEEFLLARLAQNGGGLPSLRYNIQTFERGSAPPLQTRADDGSQQQRVAERVREFGGIVHEADPKGFLVEATLSPEALVEIALMPEVQFIDRWNEPEADVTTAREIGGADYIEEAGGFSGVGVRGEVMDVGVRTSHVDFRSRPLLIHGRPPSSASHGTSTTGIVFGDGAGDIRGRGFLPSGQGIVASSGEASRRAAHTAELVQDPYFAVFQTNSWGSGLTTAYTTVSAQMDDMLFRNDILITQSQSNSGNRNSRPEAWAKNIVSIGGIRHAGSLDMSTHCWCGHASIGPAADDRIKPDLAHFNDRNFTASGGSDTSYTTNFGGTSAATPIVAGHFGLFFEMWHNGIFGNPTGDTVFESRPHMSTAKAVLINTTRQWTFSGETHDLTRVHQGWGMPDLGSLFDLRDKIFIVDQTDVLLPLETRTYTLPAAADGSPLRATLVYTDLPGTTSATQHRINKLNLKVTSPSGTVYWGNNGLLGNMWSVPGGDADTKNTVENVLIENPEAGNWTVEVIATEINEDEHLETPEVDSDYALVVSGVIPPAGANRNPSLAAR